MDPPPAQRAAHGAPNDAFRSRLEAILPLGGDAVDLGAGTGRIALELAPRVRRVVGVDVHEGSLAAARAAAQRLRLTNTRFVHADAETADLRALNDGAPYALATAHLFLSLPLLPRVHVALEPGGHFVFCGLEEGHWREAGGSRFNLSAAAVESALRRLGFRIEDLSVESNTLQFARLDDAEEFLKERRLFSTWKSDGRWSTWRARLRAGRGELTESRLVGHARFAPP